MIENQSWQFPLRAKLPNYLFTTTSMCLKIKPILYWNFNQPNITFEKKKYFKNIRMMNIGNERDTGDEELQNCIYSIDQCKIKEYWFCNYSIIVL